MKKIIHSILHAHINIEQKMTLISGKNEYGPELPIPNLHEINNKLTMKANKVELNSKLNITS